MTLQAIQLAILLGGYSICGYSAFDEDMEVVKSQMRENFN